MQIKKVRRNQVEDNDFVCADVGPNKNESANEKIRKKLKKSRKKKV